MYQSGASRDAARKHVLVVGAVNLDRFYRVPSLQSYRILSWWPPAGEAALSEEQRAALDGLLATSPEIVPTHTCGGGQAGNFAFALAGCNVHVILLAAIGGDAAGSIALADLERVDLSLIQRRERTTEAFVFVDTSGERDILLYAPEQQLPLQVDAIARLDVDRAHFTSLPSIKQLELQCRIAAHVQESAARSLDVGSLYSAMGRGSLSPLLRGLDLLFATSSELEAFTGLPLPAAANLLFADGVNTVCCKHGAAGASLYERDGTIVESGAPKVPTVDTTGAGDVFAAVFVASCLNGAARPVALRVATRLAAKSVTAWGRGAYPTNSAFRGALRTEETAR